MSTEVKIIGRNGVCVPAWDDVEEKRRIAILRRKKRIPVSKIYWKKGTYKELVEDPFNTAG